MLLTPAADTSRNRALGARLPGRRAESCRGGRHRVPELAAASPDRWPQPRHLAHQPCHQCEWFCVKPAATAGAVACRLSLQSGFGVCPAVRDRASGATGGAARDGNRDHGCLDDRRSLPRPGGWRDGSGGEGGGAGPGTAGGDDEVPGLPGSDDGGRCRRIAAAMAAWDGPPAPCGFLDTAAYDELAFYAARLYPLIRRLIRSLDISATRSSGRGRVQLAVCGGRRPP
jgi:hypothetical protein